MDLKRSSFSGLPICMNTLALTAGKLGIADSGIAAVLGYLVVFFGLVLLMAPRILAWSSWLTWPGAVPYSPLK